ncbi:non-motor microtubule binding protein [Lithospermum erythrorhizon]|uniref:Non-motor microtubule binding protein n=1 Tax=Lithospermum erythrorhizon TaxID=34254 RepID=A0AAV3P3S3_LITER
MSETLGDISVPLQLKTEDSVNGNLANREDFVDKKQTEMLKELPASLTKCPTNGDGQAHPVVEAGIPEVEYVESEKLKDVNDVNLTLETLLAGLDSKEWLIVCEALNNVRRLSVYHKEAMLDMLGNMILLVVKSLKNPRSAVCKTAIMTSSDIFKAYGDDIIDSMDPLLVQLLLKASQDKRFVCEAAERALITMTASVSPTLLLPKLQPHLKHRNPRIRAKASTCYSRSVPRLGVEGIRAYGIDKLIQTGALQLSDQLPESREAARVLLLELQTVYEKSPFLRSPAEDTETISEGTEASLEDIETISWEQFCQSNLSPLSAQAVLRVTNIAREGLVVGS